MSFKRCREIFSKGGSHNCNRLIVNRLLTNDYNEKDLVVQKGFILRIMMYYIKRWIQNVEHFVFIL